jgi:hypothetical protein
MYLPDTIIVHHDVPNKPVQGLQQALILLELVCTLFGGPIVRTGSCGSEALGFCSGTLLRYYAETWSESRITNGTFLCWTTKRWVGF